MLICTVINEFTEAQRYLLNAQMYNDSATRQGMGRLFEDKELEVPVVTHMKLKRKRELIFGIPSGKDRKSVGVLMSEE